MIAEVQHATIGAMRVLGTPIKLSETPGAVRTAPPRLGEHTEAVLTADLGLRLSDVSGLRAKGVV
jgi:formyl-CoA transferase/CoA:oxalate CoA-transferase